MDNQDLTSKESIQYLNEYIRSQYDRLELNAKLFDIYEDCLIDHLKDKLQKDLPSIWIHTIERSVPINLVKRITDKLSKIYQESPRRKIKDGTETDQEILEFYESHYQVNEEFNYNNELFNIFGYTLQQITDINGNPSTRTIPNHLFLPINWNKQDPTRADGIIVFHGKAKSLQQNNAMVDVYWLYTATTFIIFDSENHLRTDLMASLGLESTENELGRIPFVYLNRSKSGVMPKPPKDLYQLCLLIPILMTDLNYAAKFQTFTVLYGVNVDDQGLVMAPNVFWHFKSKPEDQVQIGQVKPSVDIDQVIKLATTELALWLDTLGIRPGSVGTLDASSFASGISKMIDEADVSDHRDKQVSLYRRFEMKFWELNKRFHNQVFAVEGPNDFERPFDLPEQQMTITAQVLTIFSKKIPLQTRRELVAGFREEIEAGLMSRREAMRRLNPELSEDQIDDLLLEIQGEQNTVQTFNFVENEDGDEVAAF